LLFTTYFENAATLALEKLLTKKIDLSHAYMMRLLQNVSSSNFFSPHVRQARNLSAKLFWEIDFTNTMHRRCLNLQAMLTGETLKG